MGREEVNAYSCAWRTLFGTPDEALTEAEVAFLARNLPQPRYRTVLDVCCGSGRHARGLAERGYAVTAIDRDGSVLDEARRLSSASIDYCELDMRRLRELAGSFDAVLNLWQSFGYFDEQTNADVLSQMAEKLRPAGRLILDVYHREFFEAHEGVRVREVEDRVVREHAAVTGGRLTVRLDYGDGSGDTFKWQLYTPDEVRELGETVGLRLVRTCSHHDETSPPSASQPRMQLVLQRS